jgi:hypothetical protein
VLFALWMVNITKATEGFIRSHPYAHQALRYGICNYSKLAWIISRESGIRSTDAIIIACRRYSERIRKQSSTEVIRLLEGTKLSIRDKIVVCILDPDVRFESLIELQKKVDRENEIIHINRGADAVTVITTEDFLPLIRRLFGDDVIRTTANLVEITLRSPTKLELIPGVMGYLYSLFGENGVNILETISCWTDTIVVIRKDDLAKSMEFLDF